MVENWKTRIEATQGDTTWLEQVRLCIEIGIKCTDYDADKRPDARQIIEWLDEMERKIGFVENDISTLATQVSSLMAHNMQTPTYIYIYIHFFYSIQSLALKLGLH